jgi:hypothetical protein
MSGEIITIIISALSAAIAAPIGAWVGRKLERDKYRIELDRLRAEMKDKLAEVKSHELENVRKAADILMESIVPPLKAEIINLRNDVQRLNKAMERIWGCPHIDCCPVKFELLLPPQGRGPGTDGDDGACGDQHPNRKPERGKARCDPDAGDREPGGDSDGD